MYTTTLFHAGDFVNHRNRTKIATLDNIFRKKVKFSKVFDEKLLHNPLSGNIIVT